ncbi:MAG: hypothetical protein WCP39_00910 [Chlamydiota bacterium]
MTVIVQPVCKDFLNRCIESASSLPKSVSSNSFIHIHHHYYSPSLWERLCWWSPTPFYWPQQSSYTLSSDSKDAKETAAIAIIVGMGALFGSMLLLGKVAVNFSKSLSHQI